MEQISVSTGIANVTDPEGGATRATSERLANRRYAPLPAGGIPTDKGPIASVRTEPSRLMLHG
jgi:hypothetical protein